MITICLKGMIYMEINQSFDIYTEINQINFKYTGTCIHKNNSFKL